MPNIWKTYKLEELVTKLGDGLHGTPKYSDSGDYYFINGNNLTNGKIELKKDTKKVTYEEFLKHKKDLNENTLFVSINGTIGNVGTYNGEKVVLGKSACYFNIKEGVDKEFIKQVFSSKLTKEYLENNATGTTIQNVSLKTMREFPINLPPLEEQQSIASILSAIDDKIENNLAINKTLEEMAMALYKHWFVDFGPFKDGEFVDSELGLIPKGWEVKTLEYFIEVLSKGTTPRMKDVEGFERKIPFLKVKDINSNGEINLNGLELIPEEIHLKDLKRSILLENDLLFSIAGTIGRVSIVTENLNNSNCNQALAFIRLKEKEKFKSIVYYWLKSDEVQNRIENSVVQGVQANVSLTVLKELEFIKPTNDVIVAFSNKANSILEQVLKNQKENQTLTQLRDTLLPKLISGEVRLKEFREN